MDAALQATATCKERKPLALPMAVVQETKKQVEQTGTTKSLHLAIVAKPPAAVESPVAAKPQGEHNRTVASLAVHEGKDAASKKEIPGAEAETPHLAPGADKGGDATASPSAQVSQHPVIEAHVAGTRDPVVQEAGASLGLSVAGRFMVLPVTEPLKEQVSAKDRMGQDRGMSLPLPRDSRCAAEMQHTHPLHPACVITGGTGG